MSDRSPEPKFAFVIYRTGKMAGFAAVHDEGFAPATMNATLKEKLGPKTNMVTALTGLTNEEVATLAMIFGNVKCIQIQTGRGLQELLRLRPRSIEIAEVRRAVRDALPGYVDRSLGDEKTIAVIARLFDLYAQCGGDPDAFEQEAEQIVAEATPTRRSNFLTIFQITLHELLPETRKKMAGEN